MVDPAARAYQVTLPNGVVVRRAWRGEKVCVVVSRTRSLWRIETWSANREHGERVAREWRARAQVTSLGTRLKPKDLEAQVLPAVLIPLPAVSTATALWASSCFKHRYFPSWGEVRPVCAVVTGGTGVGWTPFGWPTTDLERDLMVFRAKQLFPRVEIAPCIGPKPVVDKAP